MLGLTAYREESYIYFNKLCKLIVIFFVDNILVLYYKNNSKKAEECIKSLYKAYNFYDIPKFEYFLSIRVLKNKLARRISFVYDTYIEKIAKKFRQDS